VRTEITKKKEEKQVTEKKQLKMKADEAKRKRKEISSFFHLFFPLINRLF